MRPYCFAGTLSLLASILIGCASHRVHPQLQLISESEYTSRVQKMTQQDRQYDGFSALLDVRATLLSPEVALGQVDQLARLYQYDPDKYSREKTDAENKLKKSTQIFLSFFVPDRRHDDLNRGSSKWKIFLDSGGKRYEGSAAKLKMVLAEVQALYPDHTRWGTPYLVTFPVSANLIGPGAQLTLTGPVSSVTLKF